MVGDHKLVSIILSLLRWRLLKTFKMQKFTPDGNRVQGFTQAALKLQKLACSRRRSSHLGVSRRFKMAMISSCEPHMSGMSFQKTRPDKPSCTCPKNKIDQDSINQDHDKILQVHTNATIDYLSQHQQKNSWPAKMPGGPSGLLLEQALQEIVPGMFSPTSYPRVARSAKLENPLGQCWVRLDEATKTNHKWPKME